MTTPQLAFSFIAETEKQEEENRKIEAEIRQRESWRHCWDWDGPEVGKSCTIDSCVVRLAEPSPDKFNGVSSIYAYMERCILLENLGNGDWLAEISMGVVHGKPWCKDGTRVILSITDIWPPTDDIRISRAQTV